MSDTTWGALVYDIWNYIFSNFLPFAQVVNYSVLNSHFQDLSRTVAKVRLRTLTIRGARIFTRNVALPTSAGSIHPSTILSVRVNAAAIFSRVCVVLASYNHSSRCTMLVVMSLDSTFRVSMDTHANVLDVRQAKDGNFLVSGNERVFVFSATGQFLHELGGLAQLFVRPLKIRVDFEDGCIYVADNRKDSISVWTADYKFARTIECKSPLGMGIHKDRLYVVSQRSSICVFNKHTGALLYRFAVPTAYQLDVDAKGNVVICNSDEGVLFYSAVASGPQGNANYTNSLVLLCARERLCRMFGRVCINIFSSFFKSSAPNANRPRCTRFPRRGCRWCPIAALSSV